MSKGWKVETFPGQVARYSGVSLMLAGALAASGAGFELWNLDSLNGPRCTYESNAPVCQDGHVDPLAVAEAEEILVLAGAFSLAGATGFFAARSLDKRVIVWGSNKRFDRQASLLLQGREYELPVAPPDIANGGG